MAPKGMIPMVGGNSFTTKKTEWYAPVLAGPQTFLQYLFNKEVYDGVLQVINRLSMDDYASYVAGYMKAGSRRFGDNWRYADICTVLWSVSGMLEVSDYLEIGVRRGRSMAMVAARCPKAKIVGFDMWMQGYAGLENPGPDFVRQEIAKLGFQGELEMLSGDSHATVPAYFEQHPRAWFDLITVDGDHSELGAKADLLTVIQRLKVGGVLVFDDIAHPSHRPLLDVWLKTIKARDDFSTFEFSDLGYGVAFAVRRY